ncbi:ubiquitin-like-conjugating enzyme ATG10 [Montipora capricornis]|uniref:ubiquitin-like-conjugating enzyme ATG10 n=1 Tax=Montipora capricornis TaxID=246305 RepID=UPI0035F17504
MWKTGTLSYSEFENELQDFIDRSRHAEDSWTVELSQGKRKVKYLIKHQVKLRHFTVTEGETGQQTINEDNSWGVEEDDGDRCASSSDAQSDVNAEFFKYEYHIVYSHSYSVPVLYFTASHQDGKLVSLEEVWKTVPDVYCKRLEYERWTFLTQQEHPHLCIPFYQLHPCHTADMMKAALGATTDRSVNYLVTWLSTVGPVVGLNISSAYSI